MENIERAEKVNKLKRKILMEIDKWLRLFISEMNNNISMEDYIFSVNESFSLNKLKLFIESESSFNDKRYGNYIVSDENLDIWLQDDYDFVINYLTLAEENEYNVLPLLCDTFFQYKFTNIMDSIKWKYEKYI